MKYSQLRKKRWKHISEHFPGIREIPYARGVVPSVYECTEHAPEKNPSRNFLDFCVLAQQVHNSTTTLVGFLVYCLLLMSVMRNILASNAELTEAVFWVCCATIIGSGAWIMLHIW
jgi:hypothetical protein